MKIPLKRACKAQILSVCQVNACTEHNLAQQRANNKMKIVSVSGLWKALQSIFSWTPQEINSVYAGVNSHRGWKRVCFLLWVEYINSMLFLKVISVWFSEIIDFICDSLRLTRWVYYINNELLIHRFNPVDEAAVRWNVAVLWPVTSWDRNTLTLLFVTSSQSVAGKGHSAPRTVLCRV